jgi:hypothetical protein
MTSWYLVSGKLVLGSVTAVDISCFKSLSSHFLDNFTTLIIAVLGYFFITTGDSQRF